MSITFKGTDTSAVETGASRGVERSRPAAPAASATSSPAGAQGDSVSITATARSLGELQQAVAAAPDIDANRVAALGSAIDQGHYHVDPGRIADRMLQLERDLAAAGRHARS